MTGCVAAGASREDVQHQMHDAIAFHIEGLREAGEVIPEPSGLTATYVRVAA
ncbi:type II toxin-antitoxin system HicB family antitoxin [Solirubrobacter ginsenosidimutans]|uniref:Type II toxin-antitoxin system HicB family antitoxin n=1 Tax=Solirubrobacter ginsenosidimutans TaxID=490573 RepID=A0A9X3MZR3_9ACTN|nr:type II toxin-antitoxin system HicB family antitoxin [Solirubrobacter ginsenosidimutans]MDA0164285.1 type II toxin-antitoxin system HicB family antitoxin [Solirubrobacter ginsenosidimutans]